MKAKTINQFERGAEPKDAMGTGLVKPEKGDKLIGKQELFIYRYKKNPGNTGLIIDRATGKILELGLCDIGGALSVLREFF